MNTIIIKQAGLGFAVAATLVFAANTAWADPTGYKFEADPPSDEVLTLHLIDGTTGKLVADARVFANHKQQAPFKGVPHFIDRRIALTPDGKGDFTYESNEVRAGVTIPLVAQLAGSDSDIWGSVRVGGCPESAH